ncbi:M1 family metallopeptidase [soil metagenome]
MRRSISSRLVIISLLVVLAIVGVVAVIAWRQSGDDNADEGSSTTEITESTEPSTETVAPTDAPAATEVAMPGADGLGDELLPTRGNGGYDVATYDVSIAWEPVGGVITASETVVATSTQALSAFNIDLHGLTVTAVTVDNATATFSRAGDELTITPASSISSGSEFTTVIDYNGTPEPQDGEGWSRDGDGGVIVFGQPSGSSTWRPVNDHPLDKAAYTVRITGPSSMLGVSNGTLQSTTPHGDTTTWVYQQPFDAAPYLEFVAIGDYQLVDGGTSTSGIPLRNIFPRDRVAELTELFALQPRMIDALEPLFGPYPFDVYGSLVADNFPIGSALETQTLTVFSSDQGILSEDVIAHELVHQWFGDSISVGSWGDIWLNEGFATYGAWLWAQSQDPQATPTDAVCALLANPGLASELNRPITDVSQNDLFTSSVYLRGGMLLQALRREIGEDAFTRLLPTYFTRFTNGNARTADFVAVAEEVSGEQLDGLFDRWLNDPQLPDDFDSVCGTP